MKNSSSKTVSLWKTVQKSWSNKMPCLCLAERKKSLPDELTESRDSLPDDLIEEILSWLPVKSIARFNIVCKMFHTVIQDQKFIEKHMHHAKIDTTIEIPALFNTPPLEVKSRINGLLLEQLNPSGILRIRNHATNRILELPELKATLISCSLRYISHTKEYKVLVIYWKQCPGIGMKVLTAGTDIAWRPIEIPVLLGRRNNKVFSRTAYDGFNYTVEFSMPDQKQSKMIAFKLEDETFVEISMPLEVLLSSEREFWAVQWERTIALICRVDNGFRVWILDNGRRSKWIEKKFVFETHATSQDDIHSLIKIARPTYIIEGQFCCSVDNLQKELVYDIESKKFLTKGPILPQIFRNKNTLVSFRGMH